MQRQPYKKREDQLVTAVQLALQFDGFSYEKWGDQQTCRAGDWLVNNNGDIYTNANESFTRTYEFVSPGCYRKTGIVWAVVAQQCGKIETQEGLTSFSVGDYLVSNNQDGTDAYAVAKNMFEKMYERVPID